MSERKFDVVIVGAGFAGMYLLHRLRGLGLSARVLEAGSGVGGTWYWNRYPGARCDIESMQYSYQFDDALQQEWEWSERYSPQPQILEYAEHVADRYDLRSDIQFDTRVTSARYDEAASRWTLKAEDGRETVAHGPVEHPCVHPSAAVLRLPRHPEHQRTSCYLIPQRSHACMRFHTELSKQG